VKEELDKRIATDSDDCFGKVPKYLRRENQTALRDEHEAKMRPAATGSVRRKFPSFHPALEERRNKSQATIE
jgi:hypothetical protein